MVDREREFEELRETGKKVDEDYANTKQKLTAFMSVGHSIGEVVCVLNDEEILVKSSFGQRYVVNAKKCVSVDVHKLRQGTRVALDTTTKMIVRSLPPKVDPSVATMMEEQNETIQWSDIGGLNDQIREIREVIELPLTKPEFFVRVGIKAPKGVLLYGPPGTGKTLLAKALASTMHATFVKTVASSLIESYIGESSRVIRELFNYARTHTPAVVFIDEIDAIGSKRRENGSGTDREIQRAMMELLNQMDGFNELDQVKVIMATNRPDTLDPALLRPGRLDRKVEIPLPNAVARKDILRIHSAKMQKQGEIDYDSLSKLCDGFNGADLRNVCTEAAMFAIREERSFVVNEDFTKAVRKLMEAKKLESKLEYAKVWRVCCKKQAKQCSVGPETLPCSRCWGLCCFRCS
ncbi:hypothetical protein BLSTO_00305 [Blastocystis sp. subtype 1]